MESDENGSSKTEIKEKRQSMRGRREGEGGEVQQKCSHDPSPEGEVTVS
jgi:hypothetical protein